MNSDSESLQYQFFKWLLAKYATESKDTSVECKENNGVEDILSAANTSTTDDLQHQELAPQTFQLGEIPTVQERFQAVLKRRLQLQIQNHPPLFPWETQIQEYPDYVDSSEVALVPNWGWHSGATLTLPIELPERIFRQLLAKCQELVASSLPLGAKLVAAVESLFPNDEQAINDLAGLVLRTPYRSASTIEAMPNLDGDYFDLQSRQQMAVSLLAAKQLFDNLTLPVSATNSVVERQWSTDVGVIKLRVSYLQYGTEAKLCVQANLPTQGNIKVSNAATTATAQSSSSGNLTVEILCVSPRQPYTLEVKLTEIDQKPLTLLILPTV